MKYVGVPLSKETCSQPPQGRAGEAGSCVCKEGGAGWEGIRASALGKPMSSHFCLRRDAPKLWVGVPAEQVAQMTVRPPSPLSQGLACGMLRGKSLEILSWSCVVLSNACLCPPPNTHPVHMSKPRLQCDGIWRWDFWEVIRFGGGQGDRASMIGLVPLSEGTGKPRAFFLSTNWIHSSAVCELGSSSLPGTKSAGVLIVDIQPPKLWAIDICCLSYPIYGMSVTAAWTEDIGYEGKPAPQCFGGPSSGQNPPYAPGSVSAQETSTVPGPRSLQIPALLPAWGRLGRVTEWTSAV